MTPVSEIGKRLICDEVGRNPAEWDVFIRLTGWEEGHPVYEVHWQRRPQQEAPCSQT